MGKFSNPVGCIVAAALMMTPALVTAQDSHDLSFGAFARGSGGGGGGGKGGKTGGSTGSTVPTLQNWMAPDLKDAWDAGFKGAGVRITVVDDFTSGRTYSGNLGLGTTSQTHGQWTYLESSMVAPEGTMASHDFSLGQSVRLQRKGLNVLNLSYGMVAAAGYQSVNWSPQEASIISYAKNGNAVISKAAGNDAVAVGGITAKGTQDYLSIDLIGTQSTLFVGALSKNGSTDAPASLASYSNYAGSNPVVQDQFLVTGVEGNKTGLYGTSFAAPVISGYAAVIGSKFTSATPTQISRQLLDTARTDTILNYDRTVYGRGEASISRALAPVSIK